MTNSTIYGGVKTSKSIEALAGHIINRHPQLETAARAGPFFRGYFVGRYKNIWCERVRARIYTLYLVMSIIEPLSITGWAMKNLFSLKCITTCQYILSSFSVVQKFLINGSNSM